MPGANDQISITPIQPLGHRLFSFAVITDTHLNQGEDDCNSPFEVNRLANRRMRHVVRDLNQRDLAFVINVGDLIHPVPAVPDLYEQAAARFHEQVAKLTHPLYLTPGNHDVGDKPNDWAPSAGICEDYLALWSKHFGAHYQAFDHGDCHFVIINAQIINSGLACEAEQRQWLENDLKANKGKRIFLNSHYPPYFSKPDEEENYDNIGEPGRTWMLEVLAKHNIEALFIGHVHNFWYNRYANTDCYLLPSTSFVRQDYSEMFRIKPGPDDQAGRNDKAKLGYFVVHVHEDGHVCDIIRTYGETSAPNTPEPAAVERVAAVHPRLNRHAALGFDMRQNWMEIVEIPPTGGLDEFDRKEVRNDYPLMAIWEMGVRRLRVPMRDLLVADARERMRALKRHGHEFTLFSFGEPDERTRELIVANQDIFSAWEIGVNSEVLERIIGGIGNIARRVDLPIYLSRLRSIDELRAESGRYFHVINQGFLANDLDQMKGLLARDELAGAIDGFVFRLTADRNPWEAVQEAGELAGQLGVKASVHLRMCGANPAEAKEDDLWVTNRIAEALLAACTKDNVSVFADTFIDNDRGYFVRNGILDRLNNPRQGFHVVRHLYGALSQDTGPFAAGPAGTVEGGRYLTATGSESSYVLVVSDGSLSNIEVPLDKTDNLRRIDLVTGIVDCASDAREAGTIFVQFHENAPVLLQFS
ncbi:MAG: metallophosphoesterase [Rhodospirillales bacterium]|nr:metallophosphoesterase [Rhodospirillales bacterium]